ncbi:MAG: hypothetical protein IJR13_02155 [Bacteroidales bacterium]|nr:hypothetical protein [Bacteroidales bacterium]
MNESEIQHIETLKRLLCEAAGCEAQRATDFIVLAVYVRSQTRVNIGVNTLKRLFHYGSEHAMPRLETLNVLARSLGYRSYSDFCTHYGTSATAQSSDVVLGPHVSTSSLLEGQRIRLRWNPGRECVAEYLGNDTFRVIRSEQTKLQPNDTFQATFFAVGHVAMLANLIHGDTSFPLYEIGRQGGLTLAEVVAIRNEE